MTGCGVDGEQAARVPLDRGCRKYTAGSRRRQCRVLSHHSPQVGDQNVSQSNSSLLESYAELSSTSTAQLLDRHRATSATIYKSTPDVFPATTPFALMAELPPPSLLETQSAAEDSLPVSKTFILGAVEIVVVIFTLLLTAPRHAVMRWLVDMYEMEGAETVSKTLRAAFAFCASIVRNESYPAQWLTLNLMSLSCILRLLDPVADVLERYFIPPVSEAETFDGPLWSELLNLLCEFCLSPELGLEEMTQQRRRAQWFIAGDLREDAAALLSRLWNALGWEGGKGGNGLKYGGVGDSSRRGFAHVSTKPGSPVWPARSFHSACPTTMGCARRLSRFYSPSSTPSTC